MRERERERETERERAGRTRQVEEVGEHAVGLFPLLRHLTAPPDRLSVSHYPPI